MILKVIYFCLTVSMASLLANVSDLRLEKSKEFLDLLKNKDYSKCQLYFDESMKELLPDSLLKKVWEVNLTKYGKSGNIISATFKKVNGYLVYENTVSFEKKSVIYKTLFVETDTTNKIAGLYFLPVQSDNSHKLPTYINKYLFKEIDTFFISGKYKIYCNVSYPLDLPKTNAILILSGSGPNDRNGSIGATKIYRDIAWGLASKGNLVVRFDKRTKTYGQSMNKEEMSNLTINEEYLEDASAAIEFIKSFEIVDSNYIVLLGHSQGGTVLAPLAEKFPNIYGLAHLATPARRLEELLPEQIDYLSQFDSTGIVKKSSIKIKEVCDYQLKNLNENSPSDSLLFGLSAKYWLSLKNLNYKELISKSKKRMFFAFGGRDYNVPQKDEQIWRQILTGKSNVNFKTYEKLNHLFIYGEELDNPKDYDKENFVSPDLIEDLNNWIFEKLN